MFSPGTLLHLCVTTSRVKLTQGCGVFYSSTCWLSLLAALKLPPLRIPGPTHDALSFITSASRRRRQNRRCGGNSLIKIWVRQICSSLFGTSLSAKADGEHRIRTAVFHLFGEHWTWVDFLSRCQIVIIRVIATQICVAIQQEKGIIKMRSIPHDS